MAIVGAFDIHRAQITYDYLNVATGEIRRGRIRDADRDRFDEWLTLELRGELDVTFALEACTGWRYISQALEDRGMTARLADPAEVRARRGRKSRAKTDRADARFMRELLQRDELPDCYIPPQHILEARALVRLYRALLRTRSAWCQRMQAVLFHHGLPATDNVASPSVRAALLDADTALTPAARRQLSVASVLVDALNENLRPLAADLARFARHQPGCRALVDAHYGIGPLTAVVFWAEVADARRFSSSADVVRFCGLDITVYSSDDKRAPGRLSRQGPGLVRWALYEAAKTWARPTAPEHDYYAAVKARHDGTRAALSVARKLARRSYHTLKALGDRALAPVPGH